MKHETISSMPYLTSREWNLLIRVSQAKEKEPEAYASLVNEVMQMVEEWVIKLCDWNTLNVEKHNLRKKLLHVPSLWELIPMLQVKNLIKKIQPLLKKPITDIKLEHPYYSSKEIPAYDLKYMEGLSRILESISWQDGKNFFDFVVGNRQKKMHPPANTILFQNELSAYLNSSQFVSATTEMYTRTILISSYVKPGEERDLGVIAYDLVYQSAYLALFMEGVDSGAEMKEMLYQVQLIAGDFLMKMCQLFAEDLEAGQSLQEKYHLYPQGHEVHSKKDWEGKYLFFITDQLLKGQVQKLIEMDRELLLEKKKK